MGRSLSARLDQVRGSRAVRDAKSIAELISAAKSRLATTAARVGRMGDLPADAAAKVIEVKVGGARVELVAKDASAAYWLDRWLRSEASAEYRRLAGGKSVRVIRGGGRANVGRGGGGGR